MDHVSYIRETIESHPCLDWSAKGCKGTAVFRCYLIGHIGADKHFLRVNANATCNSSNRHPNRCCYFICSGDKFAKRFGPEIGNALGISVTKHFGRLCESFGQDGLMLRTTDGLREALIRFGDDAAGLLSKISPAK